MNIFHFDINSYYSFILNIYDLIFLKYLKKESQMIFISLFAFIVKNYNAVTRNFFHH